jgi:hypothetical protein
MTMSRMTKPHEHTTSATALQHAVLSLVLLGIIMVSLFQITHLLTAKTEAPQAFIVTSQN